MAISNVRFYKLATLPDFDENKKGIFVHVTSKLIRTGEEGNYNYSWGGLSSDAIQKIVIQKIETRFVLVPEWMKLKRLNTVESGLWFGGENGWELLTNDTSSGAITAAIDALNAGGFTQATIGANPEGSESATGSTLTIKGIKELKGKIEQDNTKDVNIAIDGVYNENTNKIATKSTVTNAITGLNAGTIQVVTTTQATDNNANTVLTFNGVKETNGVIAQGDGANTFTVGDAKLKIQIGSSTATDVFSANAKKDSTIQLNGDVFKKDGDVISVITKTAVASNNKLVTEQDIANLAGAMHYRGGVTSVPQPDQNTKKGDVWIVTTAFDGYEAGDMFIARADGESATFDKVQGNLTLGIGDGQIAKNVGVLTNGNLVVATSDSNGIGIKTIGISVDNLTSSNDNTRKLTYVNGAPDTTGDITLYHSATITDTFKVIGKDFNQSINILSNNRSIEITRNAGDDNSTGVIVDLVWNTSMDPDPNN